MAMCARLCFKDKMSPERRKSLMEHIFKLQEFCNSMVKLCIDGHEYAYLKAIVLFSPGTDALPTFPSHWHLRDRVPAT